jgi:RND family efflux transporter MFP subunit
MKTHTLATLILAMAAGGCHKAAPEETETSAAVPVEVELARLGTIRAVVAATGTADPMPGADWIIIAPQPARVALITKAEGDRVRKGELLVRFDAPPLRADLATRSGELAAARARLENARKNEARLAGLLERGIASRKEVEDAQKELREADAAVRQSSGTRDAAADLAAQAIVRARFSGIVAHRFHNPGDIVEAAASDPVLRVVDPSRMQVTASVPVADLVEIGVGQPARVLVPGADEDSVEPARVISRPAAVDVATGTAVVRLSLGPGTRLTAGTPVHVEIETEEHRDVVIVPAAAVVREEEETSVFVVGPDQKAHKKKVVLGIVNTKEAEIRSGVLVSQKAVVKGQDELPDGATVTVPGSSEGKEKPEGEKDSKSEEKSKGGPKSTGEEKSKGEQK